MTAEHVEEPAGEDTESGERTVSVLGMEVVVEEAFVDFPWRAGMVRAPVAFVAVFTLTGLLAAVGGFGSGTFGRRFSLLGLVVFNTHNVPATVGSIPNALAAVAEPVVGVTGVGRLLRGLFSYGVEHGTPLSHAGGIVGGETDSIGHLSLIEQQGDTDVPTLLYYLLPPLALAGVGYEFADSYWGETATEALPEVARFGVAIAVGYVATLLVGSVLFTAVLSSPLSGEVIVLADRYLLVVFGFAYPAIFATLGAGVVYLQRGPTENRSQA